MTSQRENNSRNYFSFDKIVAPVVFLLRFNHRDNTRNWVKLIV